MGLIKAGIGALGGTLADQWKEFFYCEAMPKEVLVTKGQKRVSGRSSNTKGSDNIISNGSGIAVADGQCMIIVEQGKVVEVCAEPGEFTYDTSTEPSIFSGKLGNSIKETFKPVGKRFTYGGDTGKDQRVYYFNTKELIDNKFGTPNPIPFRVVDSKIGLDVDVSVRCSGVLKPDLVIPFKQDRRTARRGLNWGWYAGKRGNATGKQGKCLYKPLQKRGTGALPVPRFACWGRSPSPCKHIRQTGWQRTFGAYSQDAHRSSCSFFFGVGRSSCGARYGRRFSLCVKSSCIFFCASRYSA